jgi:hypothetical protein
MYALSWVLWEKKFIPKCMFCARQKDNPILFSMSTNKKTMVDDES